jgi:hypothetical protein
MYEYQKIFPRRRIDNENIFLASVSMTTRFSSSMYWRKRYFSCRHIILMKDLFLHRNCPLSMTFSFPRRCIGAGNIFLTGVSTMNIFYYRHINDEDIFLTDKTLLLANVWTMISFFRRYTPLSATSKFFGSPIHHLSVRHLLFL